MNGSGNRTRSWKGNLREEKKIKKKKETKKINR
jgi:hypothetical protein